MAAESPWIFTDDGWGEVWGVFRDALQPASAATVNRVAVVMRRCGIMRSGSRGARKIGPPTSTGSTIVAGRSSENERGPIWFQGRAVGRVTGRVMNRSPLHPDNPW